jgi:hypothetical protein
MKDILATIIVVNMGKVFFLGSNTLNKGDSMSVGG